MEKEQRRKKIMARGTDRMALITGRTNALESDPISKCSSFTVNRTDLPSQMHARSTSEPLSANDQAFFQYGGSDSDTAQHDHAEEASRRNGSRNRSVHTGESAAANLFGPFTAQAVSFSLRSSENIRAICSVVLGVIAVIFQIIISHYTGLKPKGFFSFRPLYIVLLTDSIIVVARLAPHARVRKEEVQGEEMNLDGAMKMLEMGLVLYQMTSAVFLDCSFYLVVVILGLCLV